jgi:tRNA nucleotidyltransferase (CCA-adding enzyme)
MRFDSSLEAILISDDPALELHLARMNGWLASNLPEVNALYGVPQNPSHHPEVDTGRHIEMSLRQAAFYGAQPEVRFAILLHDVGKGLTPKNEWPSHVNHELTGLPLVEQVCDRLRVSLKWRELAMKVCEFHLNAHRAFVMRASSINRFIRQMGFEYDHELLANFVLACRCDATGRQGKTKSSYRQGDFLIGCTKELRKLPIDVDVPRHHHGEDNFQYNKRLEAIRFMRQVHDVNLTKRKT